jgi:hypothetical protein
MIMRRALLLLAFLAACDRGAPAPAASSNPAPPPVQGKNVSGQVVRLQGDKVVATEAMPPSVHGHGEALRGIWVADDGTAFAVGFMFTGTPVRDTGAVYRRPVGAGAWQLVYSTKENELGRIWGRSASDVWAAGTKVLAHFDGKAWSEVPVPRLEGSISAVWGNATDLWVAAGHQYTAHVYHRDAAGSFSHELKADVMILALGGAGAAVWAAGTGGAVFRRDKDGRWAQEADDRVAQYGSLWASAEDDVWVAGSALLHSRGDGQWTQVELPLSGPIRYVWGRGRGDVLAGTSGGIFHLVDGQWRKTAFTMDSAALSAHGGELFVAHNDIR